MKNHINFLSLLPVLMAALGSMQAGRVTAQTFTTLHNFRSRGGDGESPQAGLVLSGNTLYGTAWYGGDWTNGTVFAVNTNGTPYGYATLHTFSETALDTDTNSDYSGYFTNSDGATPSAGLTLSGNVLYGTADGGGIWSGGTVFKVNTDGSGFRALYSFGVAGFSDGAGPNGVILSGNTLYGTASAGVSSASGIVFAVNTDGTGFTTLYSFTATSGPQFGVQVNSDGADPGALILSGNTLYGNAAAGGTSGKGTVFKVNIDVTGPGFTTLHDFTGGGDGAIPQDGLVLSGNTLYGTASSGGFSGNGTVFAVNTDGTGFRPLHIFTGGTDGASPSAGLVLYGDILYGTAAFGGISGNGTVFAVNTNGSGFTTLYSFTAVSSGINSDGAGPLAALIISDNTLYGTTHFGGGSGNGTVFSISLPTPDLVATSLSWNMTNGGLDFSYANQGAPLHTNTTAKLFWANGPTTNDILSNIAIFTNDIPTGFSGSATNYVPESYLQFPPTNASRLLLVLDPDNLITETTKDNNTLVVTNTFRHVVLVMMENRSFDHLLGWLKGANGAQAGLTFTNERGQQFPTFPLAPYFQGCGCNLPDQAFGAPKVYNDGSWNGWLLANPSDTYSIGYYTQDDLPFFGQVATNWAVCDNYHAALLAETQPNRIYQHAAQTDALQNRDGLGFLNYVTLRTIWDNLSEKGIPAHYYYSPMPKLGRGWVGSTLALWGGPLAYSDISATIGQFFTDCEGGNLPTVSFVDPLFTAVEASSIIGLGDTAGNDDHPHSHIWNGESFLASIYNSIIGSPNWSSTVLIINFDEWGGFYDHLPPPYPPGWNGNVPIADREAYSNAGITFTNVSYGRLGFRVPCIVISPWSRNGSSQKMSVNHELFDHCSVLKMIENRWGLQSLTMRDDNANDLADVLDLDHPNFSPPPILQDARLLSTYGGPCANIQETPQANGDIIVSWDATCRKVTLQTAPTANGPWTDRRNVSVSPYVLTLGEQLKSSQGYFRFVLK
jgi:phospholipase C